MTVSAALEAYEAALDAGPPRLTAFTLVGTIAACTAELRVRGLAVPALPEAAMRLLDRAAQGEAVDQAALDPALTAAEKLAQRLAFQVLRLPLPRNGNAD
jgi:hypothetical protein